MPRLSLWFIRASLLHLALGFTWGALLLADKGVSLHPQFWRLRAVHIEFLLFGWTAQLAMGVAFWILPRWGRSRGHESPAWLAFILLNAGLWLAGWGLALSAPPAIPLLGRALEALAVAAFAVHAWPRIKPLGA